MLGRSQVSDDNFLENRECQRFLKFRLANRVDRDNVVFKSKIDKISVKKR